MGIILWIIFGAIAGFVASHLMGSGEGLLWNIVLGVVGALIGGFIMNAFGEPGITGFNIYSLIVAIVGAIIVIWIGRLLRKTA
jgi:uncharacterized membrane protein YeaQ/YmgE (transglycosylase-associated protein family)